MQNIALDTIFFANSTKMPTFALPFKKKLSNLFEQLFFMHFCKARRQAGGDVRPKGANPPGEGDTIAA